MCFVISFQLLCIFVENESDIAAFKDYVAKEEPAAPAPKAAAPAAPQPSAPTMAAATIAPAAQLKSKDGRVFASPFARKIAREKGIDLTVKDSKQWFQRNRCSVTIVRVQDVRINWKCWHVQHKRDT